MDSTLQNPGCSSASACRARVSSRSAGKRRSSSSCPTSPPCTNTLTMVFFGGNEPLDVARTFDMLQHVGQRHSCPQVVYLECLRAYILIAFQGPRTSKVVRGWKRRLERSSQDVTG